MLKKGILATVLLLSTIPVGHSQGIGQDICSCTPQVYEFTLDFGLFCPPVNITTGGAVAATSCLISPFGNPNVDDLVPVSVQSIDVLELGQDLRVLVQENIVGVFRDGDKFNYMSIAATPSNIDSEVDVPRAIQINIVGTNKFDELLINVFIITFTNSCGSYPVLFEGQSAGWTVLVSKIPAVINSIDMCLINIALFLQTGLSQPRVELCPFGVGTSTPTGVPTQASSAPSLNPSTMSPTDAMTSQPTVRTTATPTALPTQLPTETATSASTAMPTSFPTKASATPSASFTAGPTALPSAAETNDPTDVITSSPTIASTQTISMEPSVQRTSATEEPTTFGPTAVPTDTVSITPTIISSSLPSMVSTPTTVETSVPTDVSRSDGTENPTDGTEYPTELDLSMSMMVNFYSEIEFGLLTEELAREEHSRKVSFPKDYPLKLRFVYVLIFPCTDEQG